MGRFSTAEACSTGCCTRAAVERLLDGHRRGAIDATDRIWRLLNLQVWGEVFLTGRAEKGLDGRPPIARKTA